MTDFEDNNMNSAALEKHTWTRSERLDYERAKIYMMDDAEAIRTAKEEGREEEKKAIGLIMLQEKTDVEKISRTTGLSEQEIKSLESRKTYL